MSITSIPSPVDEAMNVSSICSQPVTGDGWGQCKLSSCSLLSYFDPSHLCFPPSFISLLSKLSTPFHPYCVSIFSFILSSFSFIPLPSASLVLFLFLFFLFQYIFLYALTPHSILIIPKYAFLMCMDVSVQT